MKAWVLQSMGSGVKRVYLDEARAKQDEEIAGSNENEAWELREFEITGPVPLECVSSILSSMVFDPDTLKRMARDEAEPDRSVKRMEELGASAAEAYYIANGKHQECPHAKCILPLGCERRCNGRVQTDREIAEMIAKFRTPPNCSWQDLANDIETVLKGRGGNIKDAAQTVYDMFASDLRSNYRTKDKVYVVAVLGLALGLPTEIEKTTDDALTGMAAQKPLELTYCERCRMSFKRGPCSAGDVCPHPDDCAAYCTHSAKPK